MSPLADVQLAWQTREIPVFRFVRPTLVGLPLACRTQSAGIFTKRSEWSRHLLLNKLGHRGDQFLDRVDALLEGRLFVGVSVNSTIRSTPPRPA